MDKNSILKLSNNWNLHKEDLKKKKFYLFNVTDGDIIRLNEISFEILKNIDGIKTVQDIFDIIHMAYEVDEQVLWEDVFSLIEKAIKNKALQVV